MTISIVYASEHHSNTEQVAETLASALGAELLKPHQADKNILDKYDLIGFGSGIYFAKHHKKILQFVDKMARLEDKKVFIFSTSSFRWFPIVNDFNRQLRKRLLQKGCRVVAEFSCRGYTDVGPLGLLGGVNRGRPNEKDLDRVREFASQLRLMVSENNQH